jgi:hypothetical protein
VSDQGILFATAQIFCGSGTITPDTCLIDGRKDTTTNGVVRTPASSDSASGKVVLYAFSALENTIFTVP